GQVRGAGARGARRRRGGWGSAWALCPRLRHGGAWVRNLPTPQAPPDRADGVMGMIRERPLLPIPLPPSRKPAPRFNWSMLPVWLNVASAVAVLFLISVGSYLYFAASHDYLAEQRRAIAAKTA